MKNITFILIIAFTLNSCRTARINYIEVDQKNEFCMDIAFINKLIKSDKDVIKYFSVDSSKTVFYFDTIMQYGFHQLFQSDISKIRISKDSIKTRMEIYDDLIKEQQNYIQNRNLILLKCNQNSQTKKQSDVEVNYWYDPIDKIYSIDIVGILKKPGYNKGYMFLFSKMENNSIEIIKRSHWIE